MPAPFEKKVLNESWTATVKVRGTRTTATANGNGYFDDPPAHDSIDVAEFTVNAASLDALRLKIINHVNLLEE